MILIADSGSTKTDWCLCTEGRSVQRLSTQGINPFHQDMNTIQGILVNELLPQLGDADFSELHFYGSGCRAAQIVPMQQMLQGIFPDVDIDTQGDLLAAARAVCGRSIGIACILGTGANSCLYDGCNVTKNVSPLGYILGDEGSGAVLGRNFVNALYKGFMPDDLKQKFTIETGLTMNAIIDRVYSKPMANRFLASLSLFIHKHLDIPQLRSLVIENFRQFILRNVVRYERPDLPVGAIGSVAYYYRAELAEALHQQGMALGTVLRSPIDGLVKYHSLTETNKK